VDDLAGFDVSEEEMREQTAHSLAFDAAEHRRLSEEHDLMTQKEKYHFTLTPEQETFVKQLGVKFEQVNTEQVITSEEEWEALKAWERRHKNEYFCVVKDLLFSNIGFWTKDKKVYKKWKALPNNHNEKND
jgi:enolase